MQRKHNKQLVPFAQKLRREMTRQERLLWYGFLRGHPARFTRQKVLGKYIVDFYSAKEKLVIEIDGSQHYVEKGQHEDAERTAFLTGYGLTVLRYSNLDVTKRFRSVCEDILKHLQTDSQ